MTSSVIAKLSPMRGHLASFDHAYAVALQERKRTGRRQYVVRTDNPLQPHRVCLEVANDGQTLALIA
jgi:hypothetical protein